ncbi:hypothetical protein niasHT_003268 [Heterodera trifolii]|uniref:Transmembrane protein n=1 Tax=Heterodera trifolii TaxID=157864 RepID=A0ABD2LTI6_9BILA
MDGTKHNAMPMAFEEIKAAKNRHEIQHTTVKNPQRNGLGTLKARRTASIGAATAFLTPIIIGATMAGYYIGTKSAIASNDRCKLAEIFFPVKLSLHDEQLSIDIEHFSNAYLFQEIQRITKKPDR